MDMSEEHMNTVKAERAQQDLEAEENRPTPKYKSHGARNEYMEQEALKVAKNTDELVRRNKEEQKKYQELLEKFGQKGPKMLSEKMSTYDK